MPACRVDPSSTRLSAINFPILCCTSSCSAHHATQQNTPGRMDSEWDDPRDHLVQMTDVHQTISRATRHLRVDLGNHDISTSSSILTPNVQNPCLLHYEYTLTYLTSHVHIHFSSIQDVIQTIHSLLLLTKIRCRTTESLSSLEDSPNKLPTLTENLLLCSPALLLTPLLLLGHILDFVLKRIYAFVRIFNTFSTNDK